MQKLSFRQQLFQAVDPKDDLERLLSEHRTPRTNCPVSRTPSLDTKGLA